MSYAREVFDAMRILRPSRKAIVLGGMGVGAVGMYHHTQNHPIIGAEVGAALPLAGASVLARSRNVGNIAAAFRTFTKVKP